MYQFDHKRSNSDSSSMDGTANSTAPSTSSSNRSKIPSVGFGTFNSFKDHDKVYDAVKFAIHQGYRLIDCAPLYGNEKHVGRAIRECIDSGVVTRDELFIMSKLWNTQHDPEDVEPACRETLQALGLEYLDLYMMHWPVQMTKESNLVGDEDGGEFHFEIIHSGDRDKLAKTYGAMEQLKHTGLVNDLGVSNFSSRQLSELLTDCEIKPIANEVEIHPFLQQARLFHYCQEHEIQVIGYSPLGKIGYREPGHPCLLDVPEIVEIAQETGRSASQVILAWAIQRGGCVIPKSLTPKRITLNFNVQDDFLTTQQIEAIDSLDRGFRYVRVPYYDFPDDTAELSLTQPKTIEGVVDDNNVYRNSFYRPGRPLESEVVIECGALRKLKDRAREYIPDKCHESKCYLIVDSIVDVLYGDQVLKGLNDAGIDTYKIITPADEVDASGNSSAERHKTLDVFKSCCDQILESGISKNSCIISLGGGVVNNLCGFLASSLYRGIALVHITTSMMGMTDAAIDFKQAVNHHLGKNLLGSYYPASTIVIDPEVLQTLAERHILNGISEALKHALCQSRKMTEDIVNPLNETIHSALSDPVYLEMVCRECIDHKVPTLIHYKDSDFNEMVPQYGHAIAHAIEHLSFHVGGKVSPLLHGEAVAIGMCVTAEISLLFGACDQNTVDEHYKLINQAGLPVFVPEGLKLSAIQDKLCYDKHYVKKPSMGLLAEIGHMYCNEDGSYAVEIDNDIITAALEANFARRAKTPITKDLYTLDTKKSSVSPTSSLATFDKLVIDWTCMGCSDRYGCDCNSQMETFA